MKIRNIALSLFLLFGKCESMVQPGTSLSNFPFTGASVLPITSWDGITKYVLLSEEAHGRDQGTYDDFGGEKDAHETHPLQTGSREAWEESVNLLMSSESALRRHIDLATGNTQAIVVSIDKSTVTYITNFNVTDLEHLTKNFHRALKSTTDRKLKEKKNLAWVRYDTLKQTVANAPRNHTGQLILPIRINAKVVNPNDPRKNAQISQSITLRPVFVSKLQEYFKDSDYVVGNDKKIKFFKRDYVSPQKPAITPLVPSKPTIIPTKPPIQPSYTTTKAKDFSSNSYTYTSVLPVTYWHQEHSTKPIKYVLLAGEGMGDYPGNWNDFGEQNTPHPKPTSKSSISRAANALWRDSVATFMNSPLEIAQAILDKTEKVIVSNNNEVTYITRFSPLTLDTFIQHYFIKLQTLSYSRIRINELAWVQYEDLENAIRNAQYVNGNTGNLRQPVTVKAIKITPSYRITKFEPHGNYSTIILNPSLVSRLRQFVKIAPVYNQETLASLISTLNSLSALRK